MPTCRDIITRAFRKAKVYAAGEDPSADDMADGLDELKSLYEQWGSGGMFGKLADTKQTTDYDAAPFDRIQISGGATVNLPTELVDDEEAPPWSLSFIEVIDTDDQTVTRYLYENGAWITLNDLVLTDEAPLASRGNGGLAACLAMALAEEYGATVGPTLAKQAGSFKASLALKAGNDAPAADHGWF